MWDQVADLFARNGTIEMGSERRVRRQGSHPEVPGAARAAGVDRGVAQRSHPAANHRGCGAGRAHRPRAQSRDRHDRDVSGQRDVERRHLREPLREGRRRLEVRGAALLPDVHHRLRQGLGPGCPARSRRQQRTAARPRANGHLRDLSEGPHPAIPLSQSGHRRRPAVSGGCRPAVRESDRARAGAPTRPPRRSGWTASIRRSPTPSARSAASRTTTRSRTSRAPTATTWTRISGTISPICLPKTARWNWHSAASTPVANGCADS